MVNATTGAKAQYIIGFNDHPRTKRMVPRIAAIPTPAPTIRTKGRVQLFNNSYKHIDDNEVYSFIINDILVKHIFNLYSINNTSIIYNDINHYAWGNLLSKIIIQHKPQFSDSNFEIYHNIQLLRDFTKLSVRHKYFHENMTNNKFQEFDPRVYTAFS